MPKILMVISSAQAIDLTKDKGHVTGYWAEEVLKPYDKFVQAGVEVVAATPDGAPPHLDPFGLETRFHYPDEDKDFLSQVIRSFAPDLDDIRVTLHHLTELDLIAARRIFKVLVESGLDRDSAWSLVAQGAKTAWRQDHNFLEVLAENEEVVGKLSSERLKALLEEVLAESAARAREMAERLAAIETMQKPLNLAELSDQEILAFDSVFFPGGHGPMVDLSANPAVARVLHLLHERDKPVATVCHGAAALLSAGEGPEGGWLFDGYKVAGFTNEEEFQTPYGKLGLPWLLENALKNQGAVFDDGDAGWVSYVVVDRNLISGQNPGSSEATAEAVLKKLGVSR
jgi:putative intracellular protease/amidase